MRRLGESISTLLLHLHLFTLISAAQLAGMRIFPACVRGASSPALSAEHTPAACQQEGRMGGCSCGLTSLFSRFSYVPFSTPGHQSMSVSLMTNVHWNNARKKANVGSGSGREVKGRGEGGRRGQGYTVAKASSHALLPFSSERRRCLAFLLS